MKQSSSTLLDDFKGWATEQIAMTEGVTDVTTLCSKIGWPLSAPLRKKDQALLIDFAAKADIAMVPDLKIHPHKMTTDLPIVLFHQAYGPYFEPSALFRQLKVSLRLGAMVATINGIVDPAQRSALNCLIDHQDQLSPTEKRSLHAYLIWQLNRPVNHTGLKAALADLPATEKQCLQHFIIAIALADGQIEACESKQIEKLYTLLGLDKKQVSRDIHHIKSEMALSPSVSVNTSPAQNGLQSKQNEHQATTLVLDQQRLAAYQQNTTAVQSLLADIFVDDEIPESASPQPSLSSQALDPAHQSLLTQLISQQSWSRKQVADCCYRLDLMVDSALETLNDWAYQLVDAPLFSDEGDIYVDLETYQELQDACVI